MVLAKRRGESKVEFMTPQKSKTTTESMALFTQTLEGNNYSPQSIKAYTADLKQFVEWLKTRRVDWDIPYRIARIDIVEFINHLGSNHATAVTRKRKLATIRGFLKFLKDNGVPVVSVQETSIRGSTSKTVEENGGSFSTSIVDKNSWFSPLLALNLACESSFLPRTL